MMGQGPFVVIHGIAATPYQRHPLFGHTAALAPRLLALAAGKGAQEVVEIGVTVVGPVILDVVAYQQTIRAQGLEVRGRREEPVQAGQLALRGLGAHRLGQCGGEVRAVLIRGDEQAWPGGGRERGARGQLGVVMQAVALVRVRPGEIEDEFAEGVGLQKRRRGGQEAAAGGVAQHHEVHDPADACAQGAVALERAEEFVAQKREFASERIPLGGAHGVQTVQDFSVHGSPRP
jgi:hypothetical protein